MITIKSDFPLMSIQIQKQNALVNLQACNELTAGFGLALSGEQMLKLTERRFQALKSTGRVEFGEGVIKKLVYAFCDSPFITQHTYESTLSDLQDIFYYFKSETMERLTDDELIDTMADIFNGKAQGSLEYLSTTSLEDLRRQIHGAESEDESAQPLYEENYE